MSETHTGLPVHGYQPQTEHAINLVNRHKAIEEQVLRMLDALQAEGSRFDQRYVALARTNIEQGFMWMNRAVFRPARLDHLDVSA